MADEENKNKFQLIIRIQNTNIDGKRKVLYSLSEIKGIGKRFADVVCKKANVDPNKRAGDLTSEEVDNLNAVIVNPLAFNVPVWMLNRRRDMLTGKNLHLVSSKIHANLRENLERMKKIKLHRGMRHHLGFKVRGQHTNSTGRHSKTVGKFNRKKKKVTAAQ
ncbi:hypothetical protein MHBO_004084 [Bonamia ostreae]|uniref:40S ribosomal protein S18 n=1 Tax=Bonamia ostreae TaxID=126728 RepID=A0ABV2ASM4_9EUKA